MNQYANLAVQADMAIKSAGSTFTARTTTSTFDPIQQKTVDTSQQYTVNAVLLIPKRIREGQPSQQLYKGTETVALVLGQVQEILLSALVPVKNQDEILIDGEWWLLKGLNTLSPDGATKVIYKAYVQRQ